MTILTENSISAELAIATIVLSDSFVDRAIVRLVADDVSAMQQDFKQSTTTRELVTDDISEDTVADWLSGLSATTAKVQAFYDQSGNSNDLLPALEEQPTVSAIAGSPLKGFEVPVGGIPLDSTLISLRNCTALAVADRDNVGVNPIVGSNSPNRLYLRNDDTGLLGRIGDSASIIELPNSLYEGLDLHVVSVRESDGTLSGMFDGQGFAATSTNTITGNPTSLTLGSDAFGNDFNGQIVAVVLVDSALDEATLAAAHRDLMRDCGVLGATSINTLTAPDGLDAAKVLGGSFDHFAACQENGEVYWYVNSGNRTFSKKTVRGNSVASAKCEGLKWWFLGGQWNVVVLDQTNGEIRLYTPDTPSDLQNTTWGETVIQTGRINLQDAQAWDIDGDGNLELVYTWEGNAASSGGVHALQWDGVGVLANSGSYTDHTLIQIEGAWWLDTERRDWTGNGRGDILFTCRGNARNAASVSGVYYIAEPASNPLTTAWASTGLFTDLARDILHIAVGNFFGNTNDIAFNELASGAGFSLLDAGNSWARTVITPPDALGANYSIVKLGYQINGQDALLVTGDTSTSVWEWAGSAWTSQSRNRGPQKMDDRVIELDIDGSNVLELVAVDSFANEIVLLDWGRARILPQIAVSNPTTPSVVLGVKKIRRCLSVE